MAETHPEKCAGFYVNDADGTLESCPVCAQDGSDAGDEMREEIIERITEDHSNMIGWDIAWHDGPHVVRETGASRFATDAEAYAGAAADLSAFLGEVVLCGRPRNPHKYLTIVAVVALPDEVADRHGDDLLRDLFSATMAEWRTRDGRVIDTPLAWARIDRGLSSAGLDDGTIHDLSNPESFGLGELSEKGLERQEARDVSET